MVNENNMADEDTLVIETPSDIGQKNEIISEEYSEEVSITCKKIIDAIRVWGIELPSVNSYSEKI